MLEKFTLKRAGPALTPEALSRVQAALKTHCDLGDLGDLGALAPLPESYRRFLLACNGGWVSPGAVDGAIDSDSGEHQSAIVFDTPLRWARDADKPVAPELVFFFWAFDSTSMAQATVDENLYELVASNRYSREDYDVLPAGMLSIAKVQHPEAADMLCISLSPADYGAIYYHYGMWHYPFKPHGDFYDRRRQLLLAPFGEGAEVAASDETHPQHAAVHDALMRVPFVRVGDSFEDWISRLRLVRTKEI
jgi:hypothetical protein